MQIAVVNTITSVCGKTAYLRWPNDIYINNKKIAGITTEISAEGDVISWLTGGIGVNVNNNAPSIRAVSCAEVTGRQVSRREILIKILDEIEKVKKTFMSTAFYSQGNRAIASEWNSLADCIGAKAAVFEADKNDENKLNKNNKPSKILARGIFEGIDPSGRCILKTNDDKHLFFNHGLVSLAFINA